LDEGSIPLRKVTEYAQQIVNGLSAAHEKGIVHRDLKPENLFLTKDDRVKILDFGLAKLSKPGAVATGSEDATRKVLTNAGVIMGTVGYMSPEQVRGEKVDHRSDIFSFGAILHEMITGQRAFRRDTMAETMTAILKEEPEELTESNPNINPSLVRIVRRCLEKKPERRFQSTSDLGFALESLSAPTSSSGSTKSALTTAASAAVEEERKSGWRERLPWIVAGAMTVFAVVAFGSMYLGRSSTPDHALWLSFTPPQNLAFDLRIKFLQHIETGIEGKLHSGTLRHVREISLFLRIVGHGQSRRRKAPQHFREIERLDGEIETFLGRIRAEGDDFVVAVRAPARLHHIGLSGQRRQSSRRTTPLHVDEDAGRLGHGGIADVLHHQRKARTRRHRERFRAAPDRALQRDGGRQFVFHLDELAANLGKLGGHDFRHFGRRGNRVTAEKRAASIEGAVGRSFVTLHKCNFLCHFHYLLLKF
jgi:hypothetical protein